jgi:DNA-binding NtrC family response regulator
MTSSDVHCASSPQRPQHQMSLTSLSSDPLMVLVVDDNPNGSQIALEAVRKLGFDVRLFASPRRLLADPTPVRLGCIVMNLGLRTDELSGPDWLDRINRCEMFPPVVGWMAGADVCDVVRAFRTGAVDFLSDPSSELNLITAIHRAVRRHAVQRGLIHLHVPKPEPLSDSGRIDRSSYDPNQSFQAMRSRRYAG